MQQLFLSVSNALCTANILFTSRGWLPVGVGQVVVTVIPARTTRLPAVRQVMRVQRTHEPEIYRDLCNG